MIDESNNLNIALHLWPLTWQTYEARVQVGLSQNIETAWVKFHKVLPATRPISFPGWYSPMNTINHVEVVHLNSHDRRTITGTRTYSQILQNVAEAE